MSSVSDSGAARPAGLDLSARLNTDHRAETNGRMAVCRRCGFRTIDAASGGHMVLEAHRTNARRWLDAKALTLRATRSRSALDT